MNVGKAYQRLVREAAATSGHADLFGEWWSGIDTSMAATSVQEIDYEAAKRIIVEYEWMRCMPAVVWHCYGLFHDRHLAGVAVYGPEYSENLGIQAREQGRACADWSKYGYEGKMILLSRGACVHWAHPHAASALIRRSMDLLPKKYEVVTATTDPAAGEIGTVYQAAGFSYVGSMRQANASIAFKPKDREGWLVGGKIVGSRSMRARVGSVRKEDILRMFPDAVLVPQYSKHRYFAFRGSASAKRRHRAAIGHLVKPYPKRADEGSVVSCGGSTSEGLVQSQPSALDNA